MSMYNHRPRIVELLDAVRAEFDQLTQEAIMCKGQRDEFEHKMNSQIQEMNLFQQNLMDLERTQMHMKKQYEEEIARLRQQLEQVQHGGAAPPPPAPQSSGSSTMYGGPPPPPGYAGTPAQPPLSESKHHHPSYPAAPAPGPSHTLPPGPHGPPPPMPAGAHPYPPPPTSAPPGASSPQPPHMTPGRNAVAHPPPSSHAANNAPSYPSGLSDIDPESVPANMKIEGQDWFALFNPKVQRHLKVDLVQTFDHASVVCCVKFSVDGHYLAAGCNQATYIYDTNAGQQVAALQDETAGRDGDLYIRSVSFHPGGRYLATGAEDKLIRIWDIQKKRVRHVLRGHDQDIYSLEFSRDGRILVSGSGDRTVRIWDWAEETPLHVLRIKDPEQKDPGVTSVAVSPDGRLVAAGSLDKIVRVWDVQTGQELERLEGHKDSVYSVAFMPDGRTLVSGSLDKTLRLWQLGTNNGFGPERGKSPAKQIFSGHKDFVLSVATSPDGHWIVSGSKDRGVQFWDPRTGQTQFMLQGHKNSVISVATSPGRRPLFATGSGDNRARIWSYERL